MLFRSDFGQAAMTMAPNALRSMSKGVEMGLSGEMRTSSGKKITDADTVDAVTQFIGGTPKAKTDITRPLYEKKELKTLTTQTEREIVQQWADAYELPTPKERADAVQAVRKRLSDWNTSNTEWRIGVSQKQVMNELKNRKKTVAEKAAASAPKELRNTMRV